MKKLFPLVALLLTFYGSSQTQTVNYTASNASVANPDRGFYKHTETHSTGYSALSQSTLTGYRMNENITLILRVFYLENFVSSPISSTYLTNMQSDFAKIRAAGIKCIVRFAYSDDNDNGAPQDATKAQVLAHIAQLKPILLANADIIPVVQAGFIGAWGEWYYTDNFGMDPTPTDYQNRKDVVTALLGALPAGKMVQLRTPSLKQHTINSTAALSANQAFTSTLSARVGHHNDCFLASSDDYGTYNNISSEYPYLEQETKYLPMGGETCAVNAPRSQCATAVQEMAKFHWSYLNLDYHPGVIDGFENGSCFPEIERRLGYRFELVTGIYPASANLAQGMPVTIKIKNSGFASPFNQRTVYLIFRSTGATDAQYSVPLAADSRFWTAGVTTTITENVALPAGMVPGNYELLLHIPDSDPALASRPEYSVRLANNNLWESAKGYNSLQHTVNITSSLAVNDNHVGASGFVIYPVPADNEMVVEMEGISDYKVTVFNTLGQNVGIVASEVSSDKVTLNTQSLSNGVYFVSLSNGEQKETKRIIVSH
ncbi:MAG TPA: DUF4832 domain-containing protein [Flavobacterium sp.]